MKRPNTVRILNHDYTIEWVTGDAARRMGDEFGECEFNTQNIRVNTLRTLHAQADTLLHEILHAISFMMGLEKKKPLEDDEDLVGRMATCLCTVWLYNPQVIKWLNYAIKK